MKLIKTIDDSIQPIGVFTMISNKISKDWLDGNKASVLDIDYYLGHSGGKEISPLYDYSIARFGINDALDKVTDIIIAKYLDNWDRKYKALYSDYNPIHNYDMIGDYNRTSKFDNVKKTSQNVQTLLEDKEGVYGFNSVDAVDTGKNNQVQNVSGSLDDNQEVVDGTNSDIDYEHRRGNIGVTTTQKMIEEELRVRLNVFYDSMMSDVDDVLTLSIYV